MADMTASEVAAANTTDAFELLTPEQDLHLLRSVIYGGIWVPFSQAYHDGRESCF